MARFLFLVELISPNYTFYNDMNTLDITNMTWSIQTQSQSALTYVGYTATLLQNGLIFILPINGTKIAYRRYNSTVLTQDGNIIIYGGSTHDSHIVNVFSDNAVLNTNSWVWPVPSVSGTSSPPFT
ncbi:galactose oxidase [Gigaspora margarita]|uniref:Galactose oxidase n=1 Tax=Gigaspora margarita TaxID=4874 RepID=A0A8H4B0B8_GIGMA|nr:galactose oxidase [Gigaspora margarita]